MAVSTFHKKGFLLVGQKIHFRQNFYKNFFLSQTNSFDLLSMPKKSSGHHTKGLAQNSKKSTALISGHPVYQ